MISTFAWGAIYLSKCRLFKIDYSYMLNIALQLCMLSEQRKVHGPAVYDLTC